MLWKSDSYFILTKFFDDLSLKHKYTCSLLTEAGTGGVLLKKVFWKITRNSQENTCVGVTFLMNLKAWGFFT